MIYSYSYETSFVVAGVQKQAINTLIPLSKASSPVSSLESKFPLPSG
jgi:hypothetical protein